jgi:hypothetical protein
MWQRAGQNRVNATTFRISRARHWQMLDQTVATMIA